MKLWKDTDTNGDNAIDLAEWKEVYVSRMNADRGTKTLEQAAVELFEKADEIGAGSLTKTELKRFLNNNVCSHHAASLVTRDSMTPC